MTEHDAIVIGGGPAGEVCCGMLAKEGLDVALVERELVGGECAYWACMPSKAMLRPAEVLAEVDRIAGARETVTVPIDPAVVLRRRDEVIHNLDDASQLPWLDAHDITLVRGEAVLAGERCVAVGDQTLHARRAVVIAVGSGASIPPVPGLRELSPWTNREGTTVKEVPRRLLVLGGGAVGCELAQAWASLGADVTLIEALATLLPGEEPFVGTQLADSLRERGVNVRVETRATAASRTDAGTFELTFSDGSRAEGDRLLVAVGRTPHTSSLGVDSLGLKPGVAIPTDDRMRVPGHDWLFAIGDVNGRALLTHAAKYQARVAVATIMNREAHAIWDGELSPRVVFTEPQVAAVGRTLQQALEAGISARAVDADLSATAGASFVGKGAPSWARIVVDEQREVIVGATFSGPEVAETLHAATIAIVAEVPLRRLVHAMPPFPTRSEVWLKLLEPWAP